MSSARDKPAMRWRVYKERPPEALASVQEGRPSEIPWSPPSIPNKGAGAVSDYRYAFVVFITGFVTLLGLVAFLSLSRSRAEGRSYVCNTEDCRAHARLLTKRLNWTLDPCEDFGAFVCSAVRSPSEQSEVFRTVLDEMRLSWYLRLRDTLSRGSLKLPVGKRALAMYAMCRDQYPTDAPDVPLFLFFLRLHGLKWPERPLSFEPPLQLILRLAYLWQSPFWMSVSVLKVPDNSTRTGTRLRLRIRPSMFVPILLYHHRIAKSVYTTYWEQFLYHIYPNSSTRPALNETAIKEVRDMEGHILETLSLVGKTMQPKPMAFPLAELSSHVPNASTVEWLRSLRNSIPSEQEFNFTDEVLVSDIHLLLTVNDLLRKYDEAQLNMHFTWLLVQYYAPVADYRMLIDYFGNAYKAAAYLPVFCGHHLEASYKVLVLALDIASRFEARDVKIINDGFEDLVFTALEMVNSSNWMDGESKVRLSEKILTVKKSLWPPEAAVNVDMLDQVYGDFPEDRASFAAKSLSTRMMASHVSMTGPYEEAMLLPWNSVPGNVLYDYVSNTIEIPTGIIAAPAYYTNGAKSMLYGGLLFLLATRLVQAFDSEGIKWTPSGTKADSILSNGTMF
ncbi:membrane metallo-endopeptidase-like 1 [Rhipicephalus microplus]|uniref:membrane metallo-endopeptidase-like 1 n=1 Tax=Rhipicephalus microplus TaxID=6941 RepID=UPI003F6B4C43